MKRPDLGRRRPKERVGAEISFQAGAGRGMREPGDGDVRRQLAPLRSEARALQRAPHRPGEGDELGLGRGGGPEHAQCASRGKMAETVQLHAQGRGLHEAQRGLDPALCGAVGLPDERERQMEAVAVQPAGAPQPELQLANGLPQRFGQLQRDEQARHGSSPGGRRPSTRPGWPPRPATRPLKPYPGIHYRSYAILSRRIMHGEIGAVRPG